MAVEVYLDENYKYGATPYEYDENKENQTAVGYYTSNNGRLVIPLTGSYFRVQIAKTNNTDISPSELKKIRLISKIPSMTVTTLELVTEMLLSDETTHIKLLDRKSVV